jgi:hypothetical protein
MQRGWALAILAPLAAPQASGPDDFRERVAPLIQGSCTKCHSGAEPEGELSFDAFLDRSKPAELDPAVWRKVQRKLASGKMPPRKEPRPSADRLEPALAALGALLGSAPATIDPGRVTLSRLNRVEYENTVRDLVSVSFDAEELFRSTTPATASTTSATCSRCPTSCWRSTSPRPSASPRRRSSWPTPSIRPSSA